jgi:transcription antitermination factor NusG
LKEAPVLNWYAVYTKPRWEKKVAELLRAKQVENYCPLNKVRRQWSDRKKVVLEPLFKSYVFVRVAPGEHLKVKEVNGILNFVNWLGKPAIIRDDEITLIKLFLNEHESVQLQKCEVKVNDTVRIRRGLFSLHEGNVVEVGSNLVKVVLPSLGFQMLAQVSKTNVELVPRLQA